MTMLSTIGNVAIHVIITVACIWLLSMIFNWFLYSGFLRKDFDEDGNDEFCHNIKDGTFFILLGPIIIYCFVAETLKTKEWDNFRFAWRPYIKKYKMNVQMIKMLEGND